MNFKRYSKARFSKIANTVMWLGLCLLKCTRAELYSCSMLVVKIWRVSIRGDSFRSYFDCTLFLMKICEWNDNIHLLMLVKVQLTVRDECIKTIQHTIILIWILPGAAWSIKTLLLQDSIGRSRSWALAPSICRTSYSRLSLVIVRSLLYPVACLWWQSDLFLYTVAFRTTFLICFKI